MIPFSHHMTCSFQCSEVSGAGRDHTTQPVFTSPAGDEPQFNWLLWWVFTQDSKLTHSDTCYWANADTLTSMFGSFIVFQDGPSQKRTVRLWQKITNHTAKELLRIFVRAANCIQVLTLNDQGDFQAKKLKMNSKCVFMSTTIDSLALRSRAPRRFAEILVVSPFRPPTRKAQTSRWFSTTTINAMPEKASTHCYGIVVSPRWLSTSFISGWQPRWRTELTGLANFADPTRKPGNSRRSLCTDALASRVNSSRAATCSFVRRTRWPPFGFRT